MKCHWLLSGLAGMVGVLLLSAPAEAGRLQSWQLNRSAESPTLRFTTDDDVQPRAQLLANPTRLVIDLPGTRLDRPAVNQAGSGAIQSLRIAQFDAQTTRIVIEFASGYTIDPQQVRVRGASPTQWTVEMPQPVLVAGEQRGRGTGSRGECGDSVGRIAGDAGWVLFADGWGDASDPAAVGGRSAAVGAAIAQYCPCFQL
ncbi:AMIN domain-containing protein [Leptolyngbya ohadii]|uniref:AMIN domain-containing protein n=1 Tax=Leptolyngbya ohadii TaxID=1962290 RepID=UPI00117B5A80|nr:AMIN domain-containing protein [Leptolyngbya ohadii]